jgi:hypothetical protein
MLAASLEIRTAGYATCVFELPKGAVAYFLSLGERTKGEGERPTILGHAVFRLVVNPRRCSKGSGARG